MNISNASVIVSSLSFDNLRLFRDIAQTRSVSRGAIANGVSQSAASQQLQELERQFGTTLLDRTTRPLVVTEAGRAYLDFCRDVLRRLEDFETTLSRLKREVEGTVRVASIYSVGLSEMTELEHMFSNRYPEAALQVEYLRPEKVYVAVEEDRADIGLVSYPESNREITALPWRQEEMVVVTSPYHPLAGRQSIRPEDLKGVDFVGFDDDLPIQQAIVRFFSEHNVELKLVGHFDNLQVIKEAVIRRMGVSIMPVRVLQNELAEGRLVAMSLAGTSLYRPLGIIHRKRKRFNRAALAFLEMLQDHPVSMLVGIE